MVYVIQVCWQLASRIGMELVPSWSCSQAGSKPVWHTIAVCTVKNSWWWTDELSETCRVSFQKLIWEISASSWFYYKKPENLTEHLVHLPPQKMYIGQPKTIFSFKTCTMSPGSTLGSKTIQWIAQIQIQPQKLWTEQVKFISGLKSQET